MRHYLLLALLLFAVTCTAQSNHDQKRMKEVYDKTQMTSLKNHVNLIKKSGQFKSVTLYCPKEASHTYFMVTDANKKLGLVYDACANRNTESGTENDLMLIPTMYKSFDVIGKSDESKPYYARNSFGYLLRNIYYHHKQDGEIVLARKSNGTCDVYSIIHGSSNVSCKCLYSSLPEPVTAIPGYIVSGASQQFVSNDNSIPYYYFRTENPNNPLVMYDTHGNAVTRKDDGVNMICMGYETSCPTSKTRLLLKSFNNKSGAGVIGDEIYCSPCIFTAAIWTDDLTGVKIMCTPVTGEEIYNPNTDYTDRLKEPESPVYKLLMQGKIDEAIQVYQNIPENKRTGEDTFFAAHACFAKANYDNILTASNIMLLQDNLSSQILETQDISVSLLAINTAFTLNELALKQDPRLENASNNLNENLKRVLGEIKINKEKFAALNQKRIEKAKRAEFWGMILGTIAKQATNCLVNAVSDALSPASDNNDGTGVAAGGGSKSVTSSVSSSEDEDDAPSGVPGHVYDRYHTLKKDIARQERIIPTLDNKPGLQRAEEERLERYLEEYNELRTKYKLK